MLSEKLSELSTKQAQLKVTYFLHNIILKMTAVYFIGKKLLIKIKENETNFTEDFREFMAIYYNTIKSINESMAEYGQYLDQFDKEQVVLKNSDDEDRESYSHA